MSEQMTLFNQSKLVVPSHIGSFLADARNIAERQVVPSLGYEGKVWQINLNGEKTKIVKRNEDGDDEPVATMRVVVLDYAKRRGRTYYEGTYDKDKISAPVCSSDDGLTPNRHIEAPQSAKCDGCPMSVKGSRVSDNGKPTTACAQHRWLVVVPANQMDFTPLRMKIAITSDYDKQSPELEAQGWFAFSNYTDMLRSKGVQHTAALVTKMKFDPNAAYPKVMFSPDRWLEPAELQGVAVVVKSEAVQSLLAPEASLPAAVVVPRGIAAHPAPVAVEAAPVPAPAPKAPGKPKVAAKPIVAAPTAQLMEDEEEVVKPVAAPKVSTTVPEDVQSLLDEWGED